MFVSIELENIGPYTEKVTLDFRVNKRDKTNLESICLLPDGEMIAKVVGIIAGNAYGKTTILDSLNTIGSFINRPFRNKMFNDYAKENIEEDDIKKFFIDFGKVRLMPVNQIGNNIGYISVDMYIDSNDQYSGYYKYSIKYDNKYLEKGLLEEKLSYRKNYNSKKIKDIFIVNNNVESEIGYKLLYKNNIINDLDKKASKAFLEKIRYYDNFYKKYIDYSSTLSAENYIFDENYIIDMLVPDKKFLKNFLNLVDNEIKDIELDESDKNNKKIYFIYNNYKLRYSSISSATKKMCGIALNLYKSCKNKGIFIIDELDNSLNRNTAKFVIDLYKNNVAKYTSQIIFTTNNAELLENFRRDQIFLIEKNEGKNKIIKYLNFVDKNNKKSRKDWSFVKAFNENIIKNYPNQLEIEKSFNFIKDFIK